MLRILLALLLTTAIQAQDRAVLIIHGGVGVMSEAEMKAAGLDRGQFEKALAESLKAGFKAMQPEGKTAADGVEAAIRVMEDSPLFNAGKGAVLTKDGRAELDACLMEGRMTGDAPGKRDPKKRAGAVTGVTHVKNPISAARAVMEMDGSRHSLLAGEGAEDFVLNELNRKKYAIERVDNKYFWTERRLKAIQTVGIPRDFSVGTVGAVGVKNKAIVAGTSTGGLTGKWTGRIGDTPVFGAGTYADDRGCGVSCTGTGELFLRHCVAHDVNARMMYKRIPVMKAAQESIDQLPDEEHGVGGLIALDAEGKMAVALSKNCDGMYRGCVTADGKVYVALGAKEEWKLMP